MVMAGEVTAEEAMRQMKDGLENGPMDADGDGCVDEDEFVAFYNDISAGIPSDDYFCYVAECVWGIHECPDANPVEGFRRPRPRVTPAAKVSMYQRDNFSSMDENEDHRLNREEWVARFGSDKGFDLFDRNEDGLVDPNEWMLQRKMSVRDKFESA